MQMLNKALVVLGLKCFQQPMGKAQVAALPLNRLLKESLEGKGVPLSQMVLCLNELPAAGC